MKRLLLTAAILIATHFNLSAQRTTDLLDRGLVAVPSGSGSFVSWRIFGEEYYDTKYNLYRDGVKVNDQPLNASCFTDAAGRAVPHELLHEGDWVRVKALADARGASAHFVYGPPRPTAV